MAMPTIRPAIAPMAMLGMNKPDGTYGEETRRVSDGETKQNRAHLELNFTFSPNVKMVMMILKMSAKQSCHMAE